MVMPAARREAVAHLEQGCEMSGRRACSLIGVHRSSVRYRRRRPDGRDLREVMCGAAEAHRRFGYRRMHAILRRDGHVLNRKRTRRLYCEDGLSVRRRRSRKRAIGTRAPLVTEALANARWPVDFVQDQFADGRRFRIVNVIADLTKESIAHCSLGAAAPSSTKDFRVSRMGVGGHSTIHLMPGLNTWIALRPACDSGRDRTPGSQRRGLPVPSGRSRCRWPAR